MGEVKEPVKEKPAADQSADALKKIADSVGLTPEQLQAVAVKIVKQRNRELMRYADSYDYT